MPLLKPGQPAPLFHLIDQRSHLVYLEQVLTKGPALLLFYRRNFEPKTASILRQWKHWLESRKNDAENETPGLQVIAISSDEWERHHQFANQLALPFPVLYDHLGKVAKRYGCQILPVIWSQEATFWVENQITKQSDNSKENNQNNEDKEKEDKKVILIQRIQQTHTGLLGPHQLFDI